MFICVHLWFGDPSTEFILSVVERAQGMLIGNKHVLKNKLVLSEVEWSQFQKQKTEDRRQQNHGKR